MERRDASGSPRTHADDERVQEVGQSRNTVKSPNKAGQPAAEGAEERGLAKGNLPRQNAPRTQSRYGAPSALERVRLAAAKDRKMRFTALLHHICDLNTLRTAYRALKREAAAGVDGGRGGTMAGDWRRTSATSLIGSSVGRTGRSRCGGCTSPRPTGGNGRSQ